jgi:hypothetical protein
VVMAVQRRHSTLTAETSGRDNPAPNDEPPSDRTFDHDDDRVSSDHTRTHAHTHTRTHAHTQTHTATYGGVHAATCRS